MALERTTLEVGDDSSTLTPIKVVRDTDSGHIAIDYSDYYKRVAIATETIATAIQTVATNSTTTVTKLTELNTIINEKGIKMSAPYDWLGLISVYRLYAEDPAIGLEKLTEYFDKINELPRTPAVD
jgi:hypothetical protein